MKLGLERIREIEVNNLKAYNFMQLELARRMYSKELAREKFPEWAKDYSVDFQLVMDQLIDEYPDIMFDWNVDANKDGILLKIEERLYGNDGERIKFSGKTGELDVNKYEQESGDDEIKDRTGMV